MNKKLFSVVFIASFVLSVGLVVFAITLTKEFTEKVIVPIATSGTVCLWDAVNNQCLQAPEPVVFGEADVYPTWGGGPYPITLIVFRDNIYRSTGTGFSYYQENCHRVNWYDPVKGEGYYDVCDTTLGVKEEHGGGSLVTETGLEVNDVFGYVISYNQDGSYKDFDLRIGNENFKLQSIDLTITDIKWEPK